MLTLGIDDAGRGPLIGPMVLAGVLFDENAEKFLENHKIVDSKMLTQAQRESVEKVIKEASKGYHIVRASPEKIDSSISSGTNLNTLEAMEAAEIINKLNNKDVKIKVVVDCPSVNTVAWRSTLLEYIDHKENLTVLCEHKADANHLSVSAASILAKLTREEEVSKIKKKYGNIGSGYPSDPYTKKFLETQGSQLSDSGIFRKSWATWKKIFPEDTPKESGQSSLGSF